MAIPTFTMKQMIEAGVHFGHNARRWNPKMENFIFGKKDNIHIINLQKTVPMMYRALQAVQEISANGGKVLFVATKRQAQDVVKEYAERCGQYYVNHRWLGGMLTNWSTVSKSIRRLKELNELEEKQAYDGYTKKEQLELSREREKLEKTLGGIQDMGRQPELMFVVDTLKESLAIKEAQKLGIPVIAVCDTNSDPEGIDFPIPGNDDAIRAIKFYCEMVSSSVLSGIEAELGAAGVSVEEQMEEKAEEKAEEKVVELKAKKEVAEEKTEATEEKSPAKKAATKKAPAKKKASAKKTTTKKTAVKKEEKAEK